MALSIRIGGALILVRATLVLTLVLSGCGEGGGGDAGVGDAAELDAPPPFIDANVAVGDWASLDPSSPGPFSVGFRAYEHTYTPVGQTAPRTIVVQIWYPSLASGGRHPRYSGIQSDPLALEDAPLAPSIHADGRYPVHVYSHGDRGFGGTSAFLMRRFASHGWVAVAPDHTGNTLTGNLDPRPSWMDYVRATDVTAALDVVAGLPSSDPLSGLLNTGRVIASGHSYGTHTLWASAGATFDETFVAGCLSSGACTEAEASAFRAGVLDSRIVGIIPMAGAIRRSFFGADGHTSVTVPILAFSGTADPVGADTQFMTTAPLPMLWVDVEGACHQFFALGCAGDADGDEDLIVGGFALAFARRHVLSDDSERVRTILDGSRVLSPRVHFTAR